MDTFFSCVGLEHRDELCFNKIVYFDEERIEKAYVWMKLAYGI